MRKIFIAAVILSASSAVRSEVYNIDPAHSHVSFRIKHLVGRVPGRFTKFSGTISYEPSKPEAWKVEAAIDPASINTDNEKRDAHLKTPDFFDTAKCPEMSFKSTKITDIKDDTAKLHGELTM
ncbi:MAG: YceI family protein, partial [Elusimicrobia bacterium]|nr:YceI family protein [Elusimicrobiota bacterium]